MRISQVSTDVKGVLEEMRATRLLVDQEASRRGTQLYVCFSGI